MSRLAHEHRKGEWVVWTIICVGAVLAAIIVV